ncbi:MAG: amidohydrolase [Microbacteriaceae bacterium]|jgi:hypothetical protein|nr:amidohydrolase [Microbacteriaceae bacterium]
MSACRAAFGGAAVIDPGQVSGSEDGGLLVTAAHAPLVHRVLGGADPAAYLEAARAGTIDRDIPSNHFALVQQPTLDRGFAALVTAARKWPRADVAAESDTRA